MKGEPRIHWFWRGAIAIIVASVYGGLSVLRGPFAEVQSFLWNAVFIGKVESDRFSPAFALSVCAPIALIALASFGLLSLWRRPVPGDGETRCRKCGYILRGISEPRCPECGEGI